MKSEWSREILQDAWEIVNAARIDAMDDPEESILQRVEDRLGSRLTKQTNLVPYTKDGKSIQGTLEILHGAAGVFCPSDLDPKDHTNWEFTGETKMFWEEQRTVEEDGQVVFIDEDGDEVLESEVVWKEEQ